MSKHYRIHFVLCSFTHVIGGMGILVFALAAAHGIDGSP